MDTNSFVRLQKQITQNTLALWWLGRGPISKEESYFHEVDYFFDGLLSKQLQQGLLQESGALLMSQSFSTPFYLIRSTEKDALKFLEQSLATIKISPPKIIILPIEVGPEIIEEAKALLTPYELQFSSASYAGG